MPYCDKIPQVLTRNVGTVYAKVGKGEFISSDEKTCAERRALLIFVDNNFSFEHTDKVKKRNRYVIIVVRVGLDKNNIRNVSNAMPCTKCKRYMKLLERILNIRFTVIYSNSVGVFEIKTTHGLADYQCKKAISDRNKKLILLARNRKKHKIV